MKKRIARFLSEILILSMLMVEMSFTSFGVSLFSYTNKYSAMKKTNGYYQLLENNNEENNEQTTNQNTEQSTEQSEEDNNDQTTTNTDVSSLEQTNNEGNDNIDIAPGENTNANSSQDEPEEDSEDAINDQQEDSQQNNNQEGEAAASEAEHNDINNTDNNEQGTDQTNNNEEQSTSEEDSTESTNESTQEQSTSLSEGSSENNNTNNTQIEQSEQQEKTSTESEIENAGINLEELDTVNTSTQSETEETDNISTDSETVDINEGQQETFATNSEIVSTDSEAEVATTSNLEQYLLLNSLDMINYFGGNATKESEVITLNEDIKTSYPIIFNESVVLNLNGHDITQEGKGYAIIVTNKNYHAENEDIVLDENTDDNKTVNLSIVDNSITNVLNINAIVMKDMTDTETIYVDNASINLDRVKIHAAETKDCIYLNNSHFSMQNSYVFGGNGNATNENGGAGLYAKLDNDSYGINLISGSIRGGNGAPARNGGKIKAQKALENGFAGLEVNKHTFDGIPCDEGCGLGGNAIYIDNEDYNLGKVVFGENMVVTAGDGGKRIMLRAAIFGIGNDNYDSQALNLSKYCLAKPGPESEGGNGTNISMVSPLKDQGQTNMCNIFSYTASAETYLMKHYRTYVNTMIAEDSSNLDFSEEAFAYGLYHFISDPLGNAPDIYAVDMRSWNYKSAGTNPGQLEISLANLRGLAPESVAPWKGATYLYNDIDLSYSNTVSHLYDDEKTYFSSYASRQAFINDMKKKIYDGGVVYAGYFYDESGNYVYSRNTIPTTNQYLQENYSDLISTGQVYYLINNRMPQNGYGGHAVYLVGWDDNFPREIFPYSCRPSSNGAFIVKNSWNEWDFMPYEMLMSSKTEFHHPKWTPAYSQFENVYHYDSSYGQYNIPLDQISINYQVKSDDEKLQAVSIMIETGTTEEKDGRLYLYKINNVTDHFSEGEPLNAKVIKFHDGLNYFDVKEWGNTFNTGDCFSIIFVNKSNVEVNVIFDCDVYDLVASYSTTYDAYYPGDNLARSYYRKPNETQWSLRPGYMPHFKAYTNNKYQLTMDAQGGQFSDTQGTKVKDIYLTDTVDIDAIEVPHKTNKYFDGWYVEKPGDVKETVYGNIEITERKDITIKASWSDTEKFRVMFKVDGSTGEHPDVSDVTNIPETLSINSNNKISTPAQIPSATGYRFIGWYKEPSCTNKWDFNVDEISQETTLYAKWSAITYNLKFDMNGIIATTPSSITKTYGTNATLPKPTNIQLGKKFVDWYLDSTLLNRYIGDSDISTIQGDTKVLYAKWEDGYVQHTIYFYANGGNGSMAPQVVNEGLEVKLNPNTFVKSGYGFYRWVSSTGVYYNNEANISLVTTDLHLSATWQKNTGGGGNGGGGGGGGTAQVDANTNTNTNTNTVAEQVKAEANNSAKRELTDVATSRGVPYEVIANNPIVQQFLFVESTALEYKKTVEKILSQVPQAEGAKSNVFTPANQTALATKTAEKKLTEYEFVKNELTGATQLIDKTTNKAVANCWQEVVLEDKTTKWYKLDAQGNVETGIIVDGNKIYLLDEASGAMVTGNYNVGMLSLQFNEDGSLTAMNYNEILLQQYLNMVVTAAVLSPQ